MKTCRKGLHQYDDSRPQCPNCQRRYLRGYRQVNRESLRIKNLQYRKEHREASRKAKRNYIETHRDIEIISRAKRRAKAKNVPFSITRSDIAVPTHCPILGIELSHGSGVQHAASPSLDRIVPSLGYVPGNVQVISNKANSMKQDASWDELVMFAQWVLEEQERRGRGRAA